MASPISQLDLRTSPVPAAKANRGLPRPIRRHSAGSTVVRAVSVNRLAANDGPATEGSTALRAVPVNRLAANDGPATEGIQAKKDSHRSNATTRTSAESSAPSPSLESRKSTADESPINRTRSRSIKEISGSSSSFQSSARKSTGSPLSDGRGGRRRDQVPDEQQRDPEEAVQRTGAGPSEARRGIPKHFRARSPSTGNTGPSTSTRRVSQATANRWNSSGRASAPQLPAARTKPTASISAGVTRQRASSSEVSANEGRRTSTSRNPSTQPRQSDQSATVRSVPVSWEPPAPADEVAGYFKRLNGLVELFSMGPDHVHEAIQEELVLTNWKNALLTASDLGLQLLSMLPQTPAGSIKLVQAAEFRSAISSTPRSIEIVDKNDSSSDGQTAGSYRLQVHGKNSQDNMCKVFSLDSAVSCDNPQETFRDVLNNERSKWLAHIQALQEKVDTMQTVVHDVFKIQTALTQTLEEEENDWDFNDVGSLEDEEEEEVTPPPKVQRMSRRTSKRQSIHMARLFFGEQVSSDSDGGAEGIQPVRRASKGCMMQEVDKRTSSRSRIKNNKNDQREPELPNAVPDPCETREPELPNAVPDPCETAGNHVSSRMTSNVVQQSSGCSCSWQYSCGNTTGNYDFFKQHPLPSVAQYSPQTQARGSLGTCQCCSSQSSLLGCSSPPPPEASPLTVTSSRTRDPEIYVRPSTALARSSSRGPLIQWDTAAGSLSPITVVGGASPLPPASLRQTSPAALLRGSSPPAFQRTNSLLASRMTLSPSNSPLLPCSPLAALLRPCPPPRTSVSPPTTTQKLSGDSGYGDSIPQEMPVEVRPPCLASKGGGRDTKRFLKELEMATSPTPLSFSVPTPHMGVLLGDIGGTQGIDSRHGSPIRQAVDSSPFFPNVQTASVSKHFRRLGLACPTCGCSETNLNGNRF